MNTSHQEQLASSPGRLLKMADVAREVSLHRATIYRLIRRGDFPKGRQLTQGRVIWTEREVEAWKQQALAGGFQPHE